MHNADTVLENVTHEILWDFEIKTDHLILARRPDLIIINKKKKKKKKKGERRKKERKKERKRTCRTENFAVPDDQRLKQKESKKRYKY